MASNREERFIMRQRGAGARELRDSGFGIAIPTGSETSGQPESSKKSSKTPRSSNTTNRQRTIVTPRLDEVPESTAKDAGEEGSSVRDRKRKSTALSVASNKRQRANIEKAAATATPRSVIAEDEEDILESPVVFAGRSTEKKTRVRSSLGSTPRNAQEVESDDSDELVSPPTAQPVGVQKRGRPTGASAKSKGKQPLRPSTGNASQTTSSSEPSKAQKGKTARRPVSEEEVSEDENAATTRPVGRPATSKPPRPSKRKSQGKIVSKSSSSTQRTAQGKKRGRPSKSATESATQTKTDGAPQTATSTEPNAIPITVHRLANPASLTFFQADADELAGPAPLRKHAGVNSIDILAQVSRELVAKTATSFRTAARRESGSAKSEARRQAAVVEHFGEELEQSMLQMTALLDHNIGLHQHSRTLAKTRAGYLSELLDLRAQRRRIALQQDAVRAAHAAASRTHNEAAQLDAALHDLELAAQRGRAAAAAQQKTRGHASPSPSKRKRQRRSGSVTGSERGSSPVKNDMEEEGEVGLELRVRDVADRVSSAGGRTGLLERLRRFNAYLEAVVALPVQ